MTRIFAFLLFFASYNFAVAQNVGIGTNNPQSKLHVAGCIRSDTLIGVGVRNLFAAPNGRIYDSLVAPLTINWQINGNANITPANFLGTTNAQDVIFKTNNAENLRILNASGNVGIGTAAPGNRLEINSGLANTSGLRFTTLTSASPTVAANNTALSVNATGDVILVPSSPGAWLLMGNTGTTAGTNFLGTTDAQDMVFKTNNAENLRILNASGNVGIGTAAPGNRLEINSGLANTSGLRFTTLTSASPTVAANNKALSVNATGDVILVPSSPGAWLLTGNAGTTPGTNFLGTTDAQDLVFKTNNAEAARILSNGNMRIGTASYPTQCGGTTAPENAQMKFAVMGGFSSFGNYNNDPAVNASAPGTTWAGGVGSLVLGMNRTAGSSNVDFWNSTDPNNGAAALGNNNRGFNFRNFQSVAGGCAEKLIMTLDGDGNLTLNRFSGAGGTANAYAFNTISDQRVKRNIKVLGGNMTQKLMELKPVSYQYADIRYEPMHKLEILGSGDDREETGLLAQELYKVFPQAVHKPGDESKELWSIDYSKLVPVLIKAFQEQQTQIEGLRKEVEQLKSAQR